MIAKKFMIGKKKKAMDEHRDKSTMSQSKNLSRTVVSIYTCGGVSPSVCNHFSRTLVVCATVLSFFRVHQTMGTETEQIMLEL